MAKDDAVIINKIGELTDPSPMMKQYVEIKGEYPEHILMYRLGDFYEMFFEDALIASRELELTLTARDCGGGFRAAMCGIPFHKSDDYIARLVDRNIKIAVCEQLEDPATARGLVKRDIVRIITPGTVTDGAMLNDAKNNYLCALYYAKTGIALCFTDISTGTARATFIEGDNVYGRVKNELAIYTPAEILLNTDRAAVADICDFAEMSFDVVIEPSMKGLYNEEMARERFSLAYGMERLSSVSNEAIIVAVGAALTYTEQTKNSLAYARDLVIYDDGEFMQLDVSAVKNLELVENSRQRGERGSLLGVLDKTKTSMGKRLLRSYIVKPSINLRTVISRLDCTEVFYSDFMLRSDLRHLLTPVLDIERLLAKAVYGTANGKDLRSLGDSIRVLPDIKELLGAVSYTRVAELRDSLDTLEDISSLIYSAISDKAPYSIREGGIINKGYSDEVDRLRDVRDRSNDWIARLEEKEKEMTGIKGLRITYNKVFGYFIEVTKAQLDLVPARYMRKQTLTNCERYMTEELKAFENEVLSAEDRVCALEYEMFCAIRDTVAANADRIRAAAAFIAEMDVYATFAEVSQANGYVRPDVNASDITVITEGRHPVVEKFVDGSYFVPNDTRLGTSDCKFMLITGPNMAGKSTYMRQVAIITVMAQIGCFVPARSAEIGITDKVFTRIGASDDLASGQSTFMLEMNEVSNILKNATTHSLIIYDEVGRGTSTYDGMSIAKAVCEYTAKKIKARTLFATHYHEICVLEDEIGGIVNFNIAAKKKGDSLIFLRKIVRGATDDSYGIEVAKLAGLPREVVSRAREILTQIESDGSKGAPVTVKSDYEAPDLFAQIERHESDEVADRLRETDINTLTPIEAMNLVFELKKILKG